MTFMNLYIHIFIQGDGKAGQLGQGDYEHRLTPSAMEALLTCRHITQVVAGHAYSIVVLSNGAVLHWGKIPGLSFLFSSPPHTHMPSQTPPTRKPTTWCIYE